MDLGSIRDRPDFEALINKLERELAARDRGRNNSYLAEENDLARRGYSRDHRSDCKQIVPALIVTREGLPLAHLTLAGNTQDVQTVETIVEMVETRFGRSKRIWVMDRGMISKDILKLLNQSGQRDLLAIQCPAQVLPFQGGRPRCCQFVRRLLKADNSAP